MGMTPPDLKTYFLIQESCYNVVEDKGRGKKKDRPSLFYLFSAMGRNGKPDIVLKYWRTLSFLLFG